MIMRAFVVQFVLLVFSFELLSSQAFVPHIPRYKFVIKEVPYTRLCSTKNILTVNGQFPGPTLHLVQGERILVDVFNKAAENVTIHWHGVKMPKYPWWDGPEFITQCPIKPGTKFTQWLVLSDEIGTLWWHAHSDWTRATVHGLIIVYPRKQDAHKRHPIPPIHPFPNYHAEVPIILGDWWKSRIPAVLHQITSTGGDGNVSDAYLINGQPGDLYPCSKRDTFRVRVKYGKRYLFRMVNAAVNNILFFGIANHKITVVATDGAYTKPLTSDYVAITAGQTIDFLVEANQVPDHYYMATKPYHSAPMVAYNNGTATAILVYEGRHTRIPSSPPIFPNLPKHDDTTAFTNFSFGLRSLVSKEHRIDVPMDVTTKLFVTLSINSLPCEIESCAGPDGRRFAASANNISYAFPGISILQAYYYDIKGIYGDFPNYPPYIFNFTDDSASLPVQLQTPNQNTTVKVLEYGSEVEIVFQGTNLVAGIDHPMHLHGHNFYVVGWGLGNFDKDKDPLNYNLIDPPLQNTVTVPNAGWAAIRFRAKNPGVWLMHCHFELHVTWGMALTFIVRDGNHPGQEILPPPSDLPLCY